ncbi:lytic transglycosylase domain-containing protein [Rossellomorea marisflavi]|uniref:lytic transglycosylase domain-containing protein n=1 Tax=Rossellomorea marisflavi TaxID=189381 RepID=UPI001C44A6A2|nr:lytic transglycosylase domain-containing protein [Bacillus sp. JRC01]
MAKQKRKSKKKRRISILVILAIPLLILGLYTVLYYEYPYKLSSIVQTDVPEEYMPIYKAAEKEYGVPWYLLAAHHKVETRFSTMRTMISPVGAEGHMQFMPCTWVGWSHPSCSGLGEGDIPEEDKVNPDVIAKYGGYGVDANGDGKADPFDIEDAIFSAANFLAHNGAADGEIEKAVLTYNQSDEYVEDVMYYADLFLEKEEDDKTSM